MRNALLALAGMLLILPIAAYAAGPCVLAPPAREFDAIEQMPQPVKNFFFYKFREPPSGIAARGAPFNASDAISPGERKPMRRIVDAGTRDGHWFIWYEHGGIALHEHLMLFDLAPGDDNIRVVANMTSGGKNDFCARARDFLAGTQSADMRIEGEW